MTQIMEKGIVYNLDEKATMYYADPSSYDKNKWFNFPPQEDHVIYKYDIDDKLYVAIFLNPTDKRGIRVIVQLLHKESPQMLFNLKDKQDEYIALLSPFVQLWKTFMRQYGFIPQVYEVGNNSQGVINGLPTIGVNEPSLPHVHIVSRQIPTSKGKFEHVYYIGPKLGEMFNLIGPKVQLLPVETKKWVDELKSKFNIEK